MIAHIVPYTKTVRGVEVFDYTVPHDTPVERGDVVEIPFRSRHILGLVWDSDALATATAAPLKPISKVISTTLWHDTHRLDLLQWFSQYYCVSLPTAWKALQFPIPQRPRAVSAQSTTTHDTIPECDNSIKRHIHSGLQQPHPFLLRWNTDQQCLQLYQEIINNSKHTLLIVPEYTDIPLLEQRLSCVVLRSHQSEPSPSMMLAWSTAPLHTPSVTIGTKKMLSLPLEHYDTIILDQEDSRSHKQFDSNPRYHVRDVLLQYKTLRQDIRLVFSSAAPSTVSGYHWSEHHWPMVDVSQPWKHPVHVVDMDDERIKQNYSWFSEPVRRVLQQQNKTILLFLNRTGTYRTALCRDCGTTLDTAAAICSQCKGTHIARQRKGITTLEKELQHIVSRRPIVRIEKEHHDTSNIQPGTVVIATEKIFRTTPLTRFDTIVVLSVDHLLTFPHFRAHERVYELLIQLFRAGRPTILQTSAPHHPVIRAAVANNYTAFLTQELPLRQLLHVPPYGDHIQLIDTRTRKWTTVTSCDCTMLPPTVIVDRQ